MGFGLSLSTIIELVLAGLLAPTLFCCVTLERRLRALRKDQQNLQSTVAALNTGIATAQSSLSGLRSAAEEADRTLGAKVSAARLLADELSVLTASGERIASRIESSREAQPRAMRIMPQASSEGLRAVR
jgi:hypothetical protein